MSLKYFQKIALHNFSESSTVRWYDPPIEIGYILDGLSKLQLNVMVPSRKVQYSLFYLGI